MVKTTKAEAWGLLQPPQTRTRVTPMRLPGRDTRHPGTSASIPSQLCSRHSYEAGGSSAETVGRRQDQGQWHPHKMPGKCPQNMECPCQGALWPARESRKTGCFSCCVGTGSVVAASPSLVSVGCCSPGSFSQQSEQQRIST